MLIELRRGDLLARVDPLGAELRSLSRGGEEFLWQDEAKVWPHSAPILFPFVGRLRGGGYTHAGREYAMATHGFAGGECFEIAAQGEHALTLALRASERTRLIYPFQFCLRVIFDLGADGLQIGYEVLNESTGQTLHFGLGSHPAFALPGRHEDWLIEFEQAEAPEAHRLDGDLLAVKPEPLAFEAPRALALRADLFDRDALIFKQLRSRWLALVHREHGERLRLFTGGAPQLGLWAKPAAAYVCLEPWFGVDDDAQAPRALADKPQLLALAPGAVFRTACRIALPAG